jgi:CBS domain-containing protein
MAVLVRTILKDKKIDGVATIRPGDALRVAAETLSQRGIGALVVSEAGTDVLGILSERDIVRVLARRGPACLDEPVRASMTPNPVTCTPEERSDAVLARMSAGRFRHLPVVEAGQMIGLISIGDVVQAQIVKLAMEKDALETMVKGGY